MKEIAVLRLSTMAVGEVEVALEEYFDREDSEVGSWYDIKWADGTPCEIPGLGTLDHVDEYGGEGKGDEYWVVFSLTDGDVTRYFKKSGGYASYHGGELDGNLEEVSPKKKEITVWE